MGLESGDTVLWCTGRYSVHPWAGLHEAHVFTGVLYSVQFGVQCSTQAGLHCVLTVLQGLNWMVELSIQASQS